MATQRKSLGRGLGAIISAGGGKPASAQAGKPPKSAEASRQNSEPSPASANIAAHGLFTEIPTDKIRAGKYQARAQFDEADIAELAESISSEGLLQPILVRQAPDGFYELMAGERRYRACRKLGLKKIVACVQNVSDISAAMKGLIENIQRANLNPMEEARGLANLMANFRLTQDSVAQRLGKSRSAVANFLRLLKLSPEIQGYISKGQLTLGHAKVILGIEDPVRQLLVARKVIEAGLNVRATEELAARAKRPDAPAGRRASQASAAQGAVIADLEKKVSSRLNARVEILHSGRRGKIVIRYADNDDLGRILEIFGVKS